MRRTRHPENMAARFDAGTMARIETVRDTWRESRTEFVRRAVVAEIERRELAKKEAEKPARPTRPAPARSVAISRRRRAAVAKKNKKGKR